MRAGKEKSFDGISIRGKETVMSEGYSSYPFIHSVTQIFLIAAALYSVIFGFATGLNLPVNRLPLLGAIIFFSVLCWGLVAYFKAGIIVFIPIYLTYLYVGYRLWKELENGFWQIENSFIISMDKYYGTRSYTFLVDNYEPVRVVTLFLIFIALPLALILSLVILNRASHLLYYPLTLPFIVLPFVVGLIPSTPSFAAYIASTFSIFVLGNRFKITGAGTKEEKKALKNQRKQMEDRHYHINIKGSILMFCSVLLLFMAISVLLTKNTYEKGMDVSKVKKELLVKMEKFDVNDIADYFKFLNNGKVVIFKYYTASGGLNEGELGKVGKIAYDNKTDIIINALESDTPIYLKGYSGSTYSGNTWKGLSDEALVDYDNYKNLWESISMEAGDQTGGLLRLLTDIQGNLGIIEFHKEAMSIQNVGANSNYVYTPYYPTLLDNTNMDIANPEDIKSNENHKNYSIDYFIDITNENLLNRNFDAEFTAYQQRVFSISDSSLGAKLSEKLGEYADAEKHYRNFIQEYYTQVPDTGLDQLRADMRGKYQEMKEKYGNEKALGALTAYIRSYIQKNTVYSLSPGTLPKGKDFVEYFLYEKKQGFCTHFATAAALAYRYAGVPSRYVEGYIAKPISIKNGKIIGSETITFPSEDGGQKNQTVTMREVRISDAGAHAWVEVYKDGLGWIPVEMTPGFQTEDDGNLAGLNQPVPSVTPSSQITPTPTIPQDNGLKDRENSGTGEAANRKSISFKEAAVFLFVVLLVTLVFLLTAGIMGKIYRYVLFKKAGGSRKTILIYKKVRYLLKAAGISLNEEDYKGSALVIEDIMEQVKEKDFLRFMDAVLKARFGNTPVTPEESKWVTNYYRFIKKEIGGKVPVIKRIFYGLYFI